MSFLQISCFDIEVEQCRIGLPLFELLYGVKPPIALTDGSPSFSIGAITEESRTLELRALQAAQSERCVSRQKRQEKKVGRTTLKKGT